MALPARGPAGAARALRAAHHERSHRARFRRRHLRIRFQTAADHSIGHSHLCGRFSMWHDMMTHGNEMSADAYEPYDFANGRHIGPSPEEIAEMLQVVGVSCLDTLIDDAVPKDLRFGKELRF